MIIPFLFFFFFFFNDTATTEIYTLSLHDALPICFAELADLLGAAPAVLTVTIPTPESRDAVRRAMHAARDRGDRKSTRLNSSHSQISYAVFCLKKKKKSTCRSRRHHTPQYAHHTH